MRRTHTLLCAVLLAATGCAASRPRVVEVTAKRYDQAVRPGETYFVCWRPATVSMVKFEYRQVHVPNKVFEQRCTGATRPCATFDVRGPAFASGGPVSAWRVSLWADDNALVAEQRSGLW